MLGEHHYTHTDVHTNCPRTLHADRYLTQYLWDSLTEKCKNAHDWTKNAMPFLSTYELELFVGDFYTATPLKLVLLSIETHIFLLKIQLFNSKCCPYVGQQMYYF